MTVLHLVVTRRVRKKLIFVESRLARTVSVFDICQIQNEMPLSISNTPQIQSHSVFRPIPVLRPPVSFRISPRSNAESIFVIGFSGGKQAGWAVIAPMTHKISFSTPRLTYVKDIKSNGFWHSMLQIQTATFSTPYLTCVEREIFKAFCHSLLQIQTHIPMCHQWLC